MVDPQSIQQGIAGGLACEHVEVVGDGQHFQALVVSAAFAGKSRLERHRLVFAALGDLLQTDVHALAITALTPAEADARR